MNTVSGGKWAIEVPDNLRIKPESVKWRKPHAVLIRSPRVIYKHCSRCGRWKRIECFFSTASRWDHKDYYCKECRHDNSHRT